MGCSAAKNLTVEPLDGTSAVTEFSNGKAKENGGSRIPSAVKSDIPPLNGVDPQTELLETGNVNNVHQTTNGLSFDIPFEDETESESIIKKHPPKRFQKLEDQQTSPAASLIRLQEKLDEAELRRQQILLQRVQSAQCKNVLKKQNSVHSINEDDMIDRLEVPLEKPDTPFVTNLGVLTHKKDNLLS